MQTLGAMLLGAALGLLLVWIRVRLFGFAAQRPQDYRGQRPQFDLRQHLNGTLACEGVIFGPTGRVTSRFVAQMQAVWVGNAGTMTEEFLYDSGTRQTRVWTFALEPDGAIRATAPDLVGEGQGRQAGSAVMLRYRIRLPPDAGGHLLQATDWMYLVENGTILNRSQFRKFGVVVAELVATIRKAEP